jgi:hypothetical protein
MSTSVIVISFFGLLFVFLTIALTAALLRPLVNRVLLQMGGEERTTRDYLLNDEYDDDDDDDDNYIASESEEE